MSVRPISFDPTGGVLAWHDEQNHGGPVAVAALAFGRQPDGSTDPTVVLLTCPVCGATSSHPIGGGADAGRVQKMFLRLYVRRAVALGIPAGQRTLPALLARLRALVDAGDAPGRFRLGAMTTEDDEVPP
jgi:hypothetical protein